MITYVEAINFVSLGLIFLGSSFFKVPFFCLEHVLFQVRHQGLPQPLSQRAEVQEVNFGHRFDLMYKLSFVMPLRTFSSNARPLHCIIIRVQTYNVLFGRCDAYALATFIVRLPFSHFLRVTDSYLFY